MTWAFSQKVVSIVITITLLLAVMAEAAPVEKIVVIDPGHGGKSHSGSQAERTLSSSNNARSPSGILEKKLTLELSLEIKKQLDALSRENPKTKVTCVLTRQDDSNPDFAKRATVCAKHAAGLAAIVSIHFNASNNHKSLGTLAVIRDKKINANYERDDTFAKGLIAATSTGVSNFVKNSKPLSPISDGHLHGGMGSNFFHQLGLHASLKRVPKCFLEIEFMDRVDVDRQLLSQRTEAFPEVAKHIAGFIHSHCQNYSP
jgi:N-acetylmuramoyl-L-alanine amidase